MLLNTVQERQDVRDTNLRDFLIEKQKEYEAYIPFKVLVDLLLSNISQISPLATEKGDKGIPATKSKKSLKTSLSVDVNEVCTNATAYARSIADDDLLYAVRYRASDIKYGKDGDIVPIINIITGALTPLLSDPAFLGYGITPDMVSNLTKKAVEFDKSRGKAAVLDTGSRIANKDINNIQKNIRTNITNLTLLITYFDKSNPNFAKGFRMCTPIDNTGIRHSGIYGVIKNSLTGNLITDATLILKGKKNTKIATTNDDGAWEIIRFASGKAKLTVSAPGCETQVIPVTILRSKIIEQNITLQAQVINLTATA